MEEALMKVLKALVTEIFNIEDSSIETTVDSFLQKSELTISPASRQDLINHFYKCINEKQTKE